MSDHRAQRPFVSAFFCEDVRQEASGSITIIGVFPDNLGADTFPFMLPKLTVHARAVFELPTAIQTYSIAVRVPGQEKPVASQSFARAEILQLLEGSKPPIATLVTTIGFANAVFTEPGLATIEATLDGELFLCAALNVGHVSDQSPAARVTTPQRI